MECFFCIVSAKYHSNKGKGRPFYHLVLVYPICLLVITQSYPSTSSSLIMRSWQEEGLLGCSIKKKVLQLIGKLNWVLGRSIQRTLTQYASGRISFVFSRIKLPSIKSEKVPNVLFNKNQLPQGKNETSNVTFLHVN